jgi:photosystem II stability/assembly factor-like uncharacterized protein
MNGLRLGLASLILLSGLCAAAAAQPVPLRWQLSELAYPVVYSVAPAQDESGIVYATAADPATGESGAFRSEDAGGTWSLLVQTLPGDVATAIGVDPHDPARVFATAVRNLAGPAPGTRLYASEDGGSTWRFIGEYLGACGSEIAFDPANSNRVYVALGCGNGSSLLTSQDGGATFQRHNISLRLLRVGPTGLLYAVGEDGVIRSADGEHWTQLASFPCILQPNGINALAVDSGGRLLLSTGCLHMIFTTDPGVFESVDGGSSWRQLSELSLANLVFDPSQPSSVFATGTFFNPLVMGSQDDGTTWRDLRLPLSASQLAVSGSGTFLYAATSAGVYRLEISQKRVLPPQPRQLSPR